MFNSLSGRLLILTMVFVMIAEVLIFVPSIARFREDYLRIAVQETAPGVILKRSNIANAMQIVGGRKKAPQLQLAISGPPVSNRL